MELEIQITQNRAVTYGALNNIKVHVPLVIALAIYAWPRISYMNISNTLQHEILTCTNNAVMLLNRCARKGHV